MTYANVSQTVVLCSGGLDSSTLAADIQQAGADMTCCFIRYGQPARRAEHRAVVEITEWLGVPLRDLTVRGLQLPPFGEVPYRNALLVIAALAAVPKADVVALAVHGGTGYRDCSPPFLEIMQHVADFHSDGRVRVIAPYVEWSKQDVWQRAVELAVPLENTHSCEAADQPCGQCRSCLDRAALR
jgi:7-cyano-7-deazaguanine synthase